MRLYELTEAYDNLMNLDELDKETFDMCLQAIEGDIDKKLCDIGRLVRNIEAEASGIKSEEERLAKKRKIIETTVTRLKEYARTAMIATGKTKSSDGIITWAIQNNPPKVEIDEHVSIPHNVCKFQPEACIPDKNAIAQLLKGGVDVPGCKLIQEQAIRLK